MTNAQESRLCTASMWTGLGALLLALAVQVPEALWDRWDRMAPGAANDTLFATYFLAMALAVAALALGAVGIARKWANRRSAAVGTAPGGAVVAMYVVTALFAN